MAKWYNYIGMFSSSDYYDFLAVYETNSNLKTKEQLLEAVNDHFDGERLFLMTTIMLLVARCRGDVLKEDGEYIYTGPSYTESFV